MSTALIPFTYEDQQVRTVLVDGEPWLVLADLCKVLGIANPSSVATRLDEDMRNTLRLPEGIGRGNPNVTVVSEAGTYEVVAQSDKPGAVAFRRWITREVLPSIRKTGAYATPQAAPAIEADPASRAAAHLAVLQAAKGIVAPDFLEAKARTVIDRFLGQEPERSITQAPLYTQDFLREQGISGVELVRWASAFDERAATEYMVEYGVMPDERSHALMNGRTGDVYAYTDDDRGLLGRVWDKLAHDIAHEQERDTP